MELRGWFLLAVVGIAFVAGTALAEDKVVQKSRAKRSVRHDYGPGSYFLKICIGLTRIEQRDRPACDAVESGFRSGRVDVEECEEDEYEHIPVFEYYIVCAIALLKPIEPGFILTSSAIRQEFTTYGIIDYVDDSLEFQDMDECRPGWNVCHVMAWCTNAWGNYECKCPDGYRDMTDGDYHGGQSGWTGGRPWRRGMECWQDGQRPPPPPSPPPRPLENLDLWMYILIAVAIGVVLLLLMCCFCFRAPFGRRIRKRVKHVKIFQHGPPAPVQKCGPVCGPPQSPFKGSVNLFVEDKDEQLKITAKPNPYGTLNRDPGHSAFIANSGFDGTVYVADADNGIIPPDPAPRAIPWTNGTAVEYVTQPSTQFLVTGEPQAFTTGTQFVTTEPQEVTTGTQFVTSTEPPQVMATNSQFVLAEPPVIATDPQFLATTEPQYVTTEPQYVTTEPQYVTTTAAPQGLFVAPDQGVYEPVPYGTSSGSTVMMLQ